ncbi:MAG: YabP/YqfC family sporulation protein, partial [Bacilli bacterium]|nr:YabP/YqfC family sporulation protein [Bacilli bacterium]
MNIIKSFRNYLLEEEFTINVNKNKVNIINYLNIDHFDSTKIIIRYDKGTLLITGNNLVVSKLLEDEILITGMINNIELR